MASEPHRRPWWLGGDAAETAEECRHCLASYAVEVEVRCSDCDGPTCPLCAVTVRETATFRCVDCAGSDQASAGEG
jgi:hypothetical protein